ncbi:841_t:CDS:2, partial [Cetraspora pellucida]
KILVAIDDSDNDQNEESNNNDLENTNKNRLFKNNNVITKKNNNPQVKIRRSQRVTRFRQTNIYSQKDQSFKKQPLKQSQKNKQSQK